MKFINLFFSGVVLLCLSSCGSESIEDGGSLDGRSDCNVSLSYDVSTRVRLKPASIADQELLSDAERMLTTPFFQNSSTDLCVSEMRGVVGTIELDVPDVYEDGVMGIGQWHAEPGKRIGKISGSAITWEYPDGSSELASSGYGDLGIQSLIESLIPQDPLPDSVIQVLPEIYQEGGYEVEVVNDRYFKVIIPAEDGYSAELFDMTVQRSVGMSHYDSDGNLITRSTTIYHEVEGRQVPKQHVFKFPLTLPGSGANVWYTIESAVSNYSVTAL